MALGHYLWYGATVRGWLSCRKNGLAPIFCDLITASGKFNVQLLTAISAPMERDLSLIDLSLGVAGLHD